jgi:hypothetical protein
VTSPLMTKDLPRVACSWVLMAGLEAGRGGFTGSAGGVKLRCGSGLGVEFGLEDGALVGFHMTKSTSFLNSVPKTLFLPDRNSSSHAC